MLGDMGEHVTQVGLRVDIVEFGGADERVHRGGALAATVGTGEEVILLFWDVPEYSAGSTIWSRQPFPGASSDFLPTKKNMNDAKRLIPTALYNVAGGETIAGAAATGL
jgi:hypothetical protein